MPAWKWHQWQELAHPAATPVLVDQAGNLWAPDGTPMPPHVPPEPPAKGELRHGLTAADLGPVIDPGAPADDVPETPAVLEDAAENPLAGAGDAKMPKEPRPAREAEPVSRPDGGDCLEDAGDCGPATPPTAARQPAAAPPEPSPPTGEADHGTRPRHRRRLRRFNRPTDMR